MTTSTGSERPKTGLAILIVCAVLLVAGALVWQGVTSGGTPDPTAPHTSTTAATFDIGLLVFREGLECVLVLAAITASMTGEETPFRRPIATGAAVALVATVATWMVVIKLIDIIAPHVSLLTLQAVTGLIAIVVLLIVMNWFFHKVYWTGWIALHTKRKRTLIDCAEEHGGGSGVNKQRVMMGLAALGFSAVYREGFEVVLSFCKLIACRLGPGPVAGGMIVGLTLSLIVAALTFVAQRRLPYKKMLVLTGWMLGIVLLVMVGEQVDEMHQAGWFSPMPLHALANLIPAWMGLWFSVFPDVETLLAQAVALLLVLGSYVVSRRQTMRLATAEAPSAGGRLPRRTASD